MINGFRELMSFIKIIVKLCISNFTKAKKKYATKYTN